MATSAQAKEVILEIAEEVTSQETSIQVQNGTVNKLIFDNCVKTQACNTNIVNANPNLTPFYSWHNMEVRGMKQFGNSPSVYDDSSGLNPNYQLYTPDASAVYHFPYNYNGVPEESMIIEFTMVTESGDDPEFNGIAYSNSHPSNPFVSVNNVVADGREKTEQGRMLYLYPAPGSSLEISLVFEILEGASDKIAVRGPGGKSIGEYLHNMGYDNIPIEDMNEDGFWTNFRAYISPYVHSAKWQYNSDGNLEYNSASKTIWASYASQYNNAVNFSSMAHEGNTFGVRSTHSLLNCNELDTDGYELDIDISSLNNCVVEVLTYTDSSNYDYAFDQYGVNTYGTNYVWEQITTTGLHTVCVPFHYNTVYTEEQQNDYMTGEPGGWSTKVRIFTGSTGFAANAEPKVFYNYQYRFLRVKSIDNSQPHSLTMRAFKVKEAGYDTRQVSVPTYITQAIKIPVYEYEFLDVFDRDKVPLSLNFNSGDLTDPSKRSTGFSKTFEIPASNRNQKVLNSMTADGSQRKIEDISWRKARVSANGIVVFRGWARIEQSVTGQGGRYKCHILQDPAYWPELIADKRLCDLTFPGHIKSFTNIVDSWSQDVDSIPYVYPAINYGKWTKDSEPTVDHHSISDFHPATYAKAIVDKIFAELPTPYTVESNFFDSDFFKKLIIPYTSGDDYNATQEEMLGEDGEYSATAALAAEQSLPDVSGTGINELYTTESYMPSIPCANGCNYYSPGGGATIQNGYEAPFTGEYNVVYSTQIWVKSKWVCGNESQSGWRAALYINGNYANNIPGAIESGLPLASVKEEDSNGDWVTLTINCVVNLQQGDKLQVAMRGLNYKFACKMEGAIRYQDFGVWPSATQAFTPPFEVSLSDALGCGTKQIDFLKGLTDLFNLYWDADNDQRVVKVEPYDSFYGSGKLVDWSQKIDRKSWSDKFIIEDLAKVTRFKYKIDSADDIVAYYNQEMDTELWSVDIFNNDLYRKENTTLGTTVFSPTFRVYTTTNGGDATFVNAGQRPVMPCMWSGDPVFWGWFNNESRPDYSTKFNIRILNWYGLSDEVGEWTLTDDNGNPQTFQEYPYSYTYNYNHDGPNAPEDTLSWYGLGGGASYQRGLFDRFYGRQYERLNGGAALRTCMMDLTQNDISQFDFRDIIKIKMDGGVSTYWTVNKIVDYNPASNGLTKVELIEWKYSFTVNEQDGNKVVSNVGGATNYGGLGDKGEKPSGGKGNVINQAGQTVTIQSNGVSYIEETGGKDVSTFVNTTNNITNEIILSNPKIPDNKHQFSQKELVINQYNGISNQQAIPNAIQKNHVSGNGIAFGTGLRANQNQTILGNLNEPDLRDTFQVGAGYYDSVEGCYKRLNAISVDDKGDVSIYGGEVVAEFSTDKFTITGDVYSIDSYGRRSKVYLKKKIDTDNTIL